MTSLTATNRTTALTQALEERGWTRTHPACTDPRTRAETHGLTCPARRLLVEATGYRDGTMIARLYTEAGRAATAEAGWSCDLHEVPLSVALAAITAANAPATYGDVQVRLAAHGWSALPDVTDEDGRLLERAWQSPDATRSVSQLPGEGREPGFWLTARPGEGGRCHESHVSESAPAQVIAALALTT